MVWLFGAGNMALEYAKVLQSLEVPFSVVGRGERSAQEFELKTGVKVDCRAPREIFSEPPVREDKAIICVNTLGCYELAMSLLELGFKSLLVEKPGVLNLIQGRALREACERNNAKLFIALNRRQYASVEKAREILTQDGGLTSMQFEFTEWGHVIEKLNKPEQELAHWFLCNSLHVVDLAFSFAGKPEYLHAFHQGQLTWHRPAIFSGAGKTVGGVPFSYHADWASAGRWGIELQTDKRKIYLSPIEKVRVQLKGSIVIEDVEIDDQLDMAFKPGLYRQTEYFVNGVTTELVAFEDYLSNLSDYIEIAGYQKV